MPVYQLLGGKCRDTVRIAAVLAMRGTVGSLLELAAEFHARGFRHLVLKIGVDTALEAIARLRQHAPHIESNRALALTLGYPEYCSEGSEARPSTICICCICNA